MDSILNQPMCRFGGSKTVMQTLSIAGFILPVIVLCAVGTSFFKKIDVYGCFLDGVENGMKTVISIFPPLLGILVASSMMRESGIFALITQLISPLTQSVHIPDGAILLALMRPVSGSGALGILSDIVNSYGADSVTALTAAVMMSSTETTLYTLCIYFRGTAVTNTRRLLAAALFADVVCAAASGVICSIIFGH